MRLEGAITVFRNIEYFRQFMGAGYQSEKTGEVIEIARLYYKYGYWLVIVAPRLKMHARLERYTPLGLLL